MGAVGLGVMQLSSYIAGTYSLRRKVIDSATGHPRPIISFSTQYIPVLTAVAQSYVMAAFSLEARAIFVSLDGRIYDQHLVAAAYKAGILKLAKATPLILGDRCGAQGLMEVNLLGVLVADTRGASIAEGDVLTISIRFAMDILLGKLKRPEITYPDSILAKHEESIAKELKAIVASAPSHRDTIVQRRVLPQCQSFIEAISYRMAYEAAVKAKVDPRLIDMFVASVIKMDPTWYSENAGIKKAQQEEMEETAAFTLLPELPRLLQGLDVKEYVHAPIVSDEAWSAFVSSLETLKRFGDERATVAAFEPQVVSHL